jgi:hypothetical protein
MPRFNETLAPLVALEPFLNAHPAYALAGFTLWLVCNYLITKKK